MNFPAKRFDYSISPMASEQLPTFNSKYSFTKTSKDPNMSAMSPIKPRSQMNASFDTRSKQTAPVHSNNKYGQHVPNRHEEMR